MKIQRAYKTELDPNDKQRMMMGRCCGASRYVYNWGLKEWEEWYELNGYPSSISLKRYFNAAKDDICPWIRLVPFAITESSLRNLDTAFKRYFKEKKDGTVAARKAKLKAGGKWETRSAKLAKKGRIGYKADPGYPQFKQRGKNSSFQLRNAKVEDDRVRLTGIGWVHLKERGYLPTTDSGIKFGTYATISERAGRWYISTQVEEEIPDPANGSTLVVGVDFGLKALAVCSDGTVYKNPHALREAQRKLGRLQRELDRRTKGGANWRKTKAKIQRQHAKVANIRQHTLHDVTHDIIVNKHPAVVAIEDLNVSGMMSNHHLAQAIADVGFYELRRQIEYKAKWHGVEIVMVDRWFPSSKTCSQCGCIKDDLTLGDRVFHCADCGFEIDRDLNASVNLAAYGIRVLNDRETHDDCLGS